MRAPILFSSDYKHFYCQYNEPFYVKKLKLKMLTAVANESNTYEIGEDLSKAECFAKFNKTEDNEIKGLIVGGN